MKRQNFSRYYPNVAKWDGLLNKINYLRNSIVLAPADSHDEQELLNHGVSSDYTVGYGDGRNNLYRITLMTDGEFIFEKYITTGYTEGRDEVSQLTGYSTQGRGNTHMLRDPYWKPLAADDPRRLTLEEHKLELLPLLKTKQEEVKQKKQAGLDRMKDELRTLLNRAIEIYPDIAGSISERDRHVITFEYTSLVNIAKVVEMDFPAEPMSFTATEETREINKELEESPLAQEHDITDEQQTSLPASLDRLQELQRRFGKK